MIDEPTARALSILLTALGVPALLFSLGRSLWKWWTGRAGRERVKNNDLVSRLRRAEADRETEAREKRQALEYASRLRRQLIESGVEPLPWPQKLGSRRSATPGPFERRREAEREGVRDEERRDENRRRDEPETDEVDQPDYWG